MMSWGPVWISTHFPLDKMAAISQTTFSTHFFHGNVRISNKFSLKFVAKGPVDNKPPLVQVMAITWTNADPLYRRIYIHPAPKVMADFFSRYNNHGWPSTQPGTCTQPCPIVHTAVPPLFTQPCPGRTMSTAVCLRCRAVCKLPSCVEGHPW